MSAASPWGPSNAFGSTPLYPAVVNDGNSGTAKTIDFSTAPEHTLTLTDNCTLTLTAPSAPGRCILNLINGGAFTITWPSGTRAPGGSLSLTASGEDKLALNWNGTNWDVTVGGLDYQDL